jgi:hypothetical protein
MCDLELQIRSDKAHDYSGDEDVLSNFKQLAEMTKTLKLDMTTPEGWGIGMVVLKITRIANLLQRGMASCESLDDSFLDARVYLELALECWRESHPPDPYIAVPVPYPPNSGNGSATNDGPDMSEIHWDTVSAELEWVPYD